MDVKSTIAQRRNAFVAAFNSEDLVRLTELCADDVIRMPPKQPVLVGATASAEWWGMGFDAGRTRLNVTPRELYVSDGWAFDWFDWAVLVVPTDGNAPRVDRGSSCWMWHRERDGVWRIARAIWNSSQELPSVWAGGSGSFQSSEFTTH